MTAPTPGRLPVGPYTDLVPGPVTFVVVMLVALVVMEPVTYLVHRFVMHGPGFGWHRSHHGRRLSRFERNDWYPVVFASTTIAVMAVGSFVSPLWFLLPIGSGVTLYGLAYLIVHDGFIHRRLPGLGRFVVLEPLAEAHELHHRFGGEPYGMLVPVVPTALRARVVARDLKVGATSSSPTGEPADSPVGGG